MSLVTPNAIRAAVTELRELLEEEIYFVVDQIKSETRPGGNMDWVKHCAQKTQLLEQHKEALAELEEDAVDVLFHTLSYNSDDIEVATGGLRTLTIEVSQGMLNQHLLTLTDARRQGVVSHGEKFKISLADGTEFATEICDPGNKLRERGLIRRFYEDAKITDGDKVILKEITSGTWRLLSASSPEGQEIVKAREAKALAALADLAERFSTQPASKEPSK